METHVAEWLQVPLVQMAQRLHSEVLEYIHGLPWRGEPWGGPPSSQYPCHLGESCQGYVEAAAQPPGGEGYISDPGRSAAWGLQIPQAPLPAEATSRRHAADPDCGSLFSMGNKLCRPNCSEIALATTSHILITQVPLHSVLPTMYHHMLEPCPTPEDNEENMKWLEFEAVFCVK